MPRGRPRKSVEEHIRNGTYQRSRHGPKPGETDTKPTKTYTEPTMPRGMPKRRQPVLPKHGYQPPFPP